MDPRNDFDVFGDWVISLNQVLNPSTRWLILMIIPFQAVNAIEVMLEQHVYVSIIMPPYNPCNLIYQGGYKKDGEDSQCELPCTKAK